MEYADILWDGCSVSESDLLEHVQYINQLGWSQGLCKVQANQDYWKS